MSENFFHLFLHNSSRRTVDQEIWNIPSRFQACPLSFVVHIEETGYFFPMSISKKICKSKLEMK